MKIALADFVKIVRGEIVDPFYKERVEESDKMLLHAFPNRRLIERLALVRFPNEPHYVIDFKIANWKAITSTYIQKITKVIAKVPKSQEFIVTYPNPAFRDFLTLEYPIYENFWNWVWTKLLQAFLIEPNALAVLWFSQKGPFIKLFTANQVLYYEPGEFVVLSSEQPNRYYYIDDTAIREFELESGGWGYNNISVNETVINEFNYEFLPFCFVGGNYKSFHENSVFTSVISGVCPFWEQALIAFSELDAGIKQHVFPDKWRFLSGTCTNCNGTGKVSFRGVGDRVEYAQCSVCNGTGDPPTGMFAEILIQPNTGLTEKAPIPPLGYVQKDFEPIEFLSSYYKEMLREGLRAVNMEFLAEVPLNESGRAKEVDRLEVNSFLYEVANIFLNGCVNKCLLFLAKALYEDKDTIYIKKEVVPTVVIPTEFDHIDNGAWDQLEKMYSSNVSNEIIAETERRLIDKKFQSSPYERSILLLCNTIDPLRGYKTEEKIELYGAGAVTTEDFILSIHIRSIVRKVIDSTYGYSILNKPFEEQLDIVKKEAKKIVKLIIKENEQYDQPKQPEKDMVEAESGLSSKESGTTNGEYNSTGSGRSVSKNRSRVQS